MNVLREKRLYGNIWKTKVFQAISAIGFFLPVIVLFWQENGLSLLQIMILQSLYSIAIVFLEVPSGYFADLFGRKKSLVFSAISLTCGIIVYSLGNGFYDFLVAEILWAFGGAFMSGADSAMVYDSLVDLKKENLFKKIWGDISFYRFMAIAISSVLGGFIAYFGSRYTLYSQIPFVALMIPLAFSMYEPKRHKRIAEKGYLHDLFVILYDATIKNKKLRLIFFYAAFIYGFGQGILWLYQPYFSFTGVDIIYFGVLFASFNIVAAISSKYADAIERFFGRKLSVSLLPFLLTASFFLMSLFTYAFSFVFVYIQQFVRGFSRPLIEEQTHLLTTSDVRATVISAQSLLSRLLYALLIPFLGLIADVYSLVQAITVLGITSLFTGSVVVWLFYKNNVL